MADVYCDMSLGTGSNNGTDWANAYQSLVTALNGSNVVGGDILYVKNSESLAGDQNITLGGTAANPSIVLGCLAATTNEPPVLADLIPGWRTGEARTEANLAYNDGGLPVFATTGTGSSCEIRGQGHVYGLGFTGARDFLITAGEAWPRFEECLINHCTVDSNVTMVTGSTGDTPAGSRYKNCHVDFNGGDGWNLRRGGSLIFEGGKVTATGAEVIIADGIGDATFTGTDLSDQAHTLYAAGVADSRTLICFKNCQLNASTSIVSGTPDHPFRVEVYQCTNTTGKSSGTIINVDVSTESGNITEETTAVRTGGANDGSTDWSLAFTPNANGTRDAYLGLEGPWMAFKITGDGTAQTVTVYIANSGAADYNNDDVWLEVMYPSEGGTAQYDNQTTQMNLLGTPSAVTDDTVSTWGTGGNNPQKLQASISPDYVGRAYCRVVFAKNFPSSPETLYADPLPEVS